MTQNLCPCGHALPLEQCCGQYHAGMPAPSAETLMRSRYSAYVLGLIDYLCATTLPAQQAGLDLPSIESWSRNSQWLGLNVEESQLVSGKPDHAYVTFTARWNDQEGEHSHRERSSFVRPQERWYFIDPTVKLLSGRNDPCPCNGGQKFKKCCAAFL